MVNGLLNSSDQDDVGKRSARARANTGGELHSFYVSVMLEE